VWWLFWAILLFSCIAASNCWPCRPSPMVFRVIAAGCSARSWAGLVCFAIGFYLANLASQVVVASSSSGPQCSPPLTGWRFIAFAGAMAPAADRRGGADDRLDCFRFAFWAAIAVAVAVAFAWAARRWPLSSFARVESVRIKTSNDRMLMGHAPL